MSEKIPEFQLATWAAAASVLMDEFSELSQEEALRVAARVIDAEKEALVPFGPELTLGAAETLWAYEQRPPGRIRRWLIRRFT